MSNCRSRASCLWRMHLTNSAHWTGEQGWGTGTVVAAVCGGAAAGVMAELSEEALLSVLPTIRVPKAGDRVHKDECAFSFDTPVSPIPTPAATTTSFHLPGHSAGACKAWATASL